MKEATSARTSGIYFGYIKACAFSILLSNFKVIVYHIPYCTGYSLDNWKIAVNTMKEKKGKNNRIGNLRAINLIEADFNFNNKTMAKEILLCAKRNRLLQKRRV